MNLVATSCNKNECRKSLYFAGSIILCPLQLVARNTEKFELPTKIIIVKEDLLMKYP